jgi:hypothetical protein
MLTNALSSHDALASTRRFWVTGSNAKAAKWELAALGVMGPRPPS